MPRRKPPPRAEAALSKQQAVARDIVHTAPPLPWQCAPCGRRGRFRNAAREFWTAPAKLCSAGSLRIPSGWVLRLFPDGSRRTARGFRWSRRFDPAPRAPPKFDAGRFRRDTPCTPFPLARAGEQGNLSRCRYGRPRTVHAASERVLRPRTAASSTTPRACDP